MINYFLDQDLADVTQPIIKGGERIQGLQPYIHPILVDESVIGHSKASQKLAKQIQQAATDIKPVVLQSEAGSGKTFVAGLIHGHSLLKNHPFA
ncbi:MAG: sigma 54-interacting transcriptional regulator, partial [Crocosphaera sp.]